MKTLNASYIQELAKTYTRYVRGWCKLFRFFWRSLPKNYSKFLSKPVADYVYLTICNEKGFDMVSASLYSLCRNADQLPSKIYIISDGSWETTEGRKYFERYQLPVECLSWETCAHFYADSCPALNEWAQKHIWGKKMAAILYCSERHATVFSDPDVLWYQSPLKNLLSENTALKISVDNSLSYDQECIKSLHLEYLNERELPINCGVVYIKGGLALLNDDALRIIDYQAQHCGPFAEQTVFAAMEAQYNCHWEENEVRSDLTEARHQFSASTERTEQLIARHYLWLMKPLYWLDLFRMYFCR